MHKDNNNFVIGPIGGSKLLLIPIRHKTGVNKLDRTVIIQIFVYLTFSTDVDAVVDEIALKEPLVTMTKTDQVRKLIIRILPFVYFATIACFCCILLN